MRRVRLLLWVSLACLACGGAAGESVVSSRASFDFGDWVAGNDYSLPPTSFRISNAGPRVTGELSTWVSDALDFRLDGGSCAGARLAPKASCEISIAFWPVRIGPLSAKLEIRDGGAVVARTLLTGRGISGCSLSWSPDPVEFGTIALGGAVDRELTLENTGGVGCRALSLAVGGTDASEFELVPGACPNGLAPGASCAVDVRFAPTTPGEKSAVIGALVDEGWSTENSGAVLHGSATAP